MPPTHRRRSGLLFVAFVLVAVAIGGAVLWSGDEPPPRAPATRQVQIDVLDGPQRQERVSIDATLYAPAQTPAPAVLLAHGFGGNKNTVADQARALATRGFTVLAYSSRGFGHSSGKSALGAAEYEVADAHQLLDWLARQPEVLRDADNDPRVGVAGDSYGGALSLLLAGSDRRVDAVASVMTYNDLEQALLPNAAATTGPTADTAARGVSADRGVFKQAWASMLFSAGAAPLGSTTNTACGNFTAQVCAAYTEIAETGRPDGPARELLARVSPSRVTHSIKAPTLLVQGEQDSLFGLDQADANARQVAAAGGRVKMLWYAGGHNGPPPPRRIRARIADWFAYSLGGVAAVANPGTGFTYDLPTRRGKSVRTVTAPAYPGLSSEHSPPVRRRAMPLHGQSTTVIHPPGGSPASVSSLPAAQAMTGMSRPKDWPGQVALFDGDPVRRQVVLSGVPTTKLTVASARGSDEAVLFAKLYDVSPGGRRSLLGGGVSPLRVPDLPPDGGPVEVRVSLPGTVHALPGGHHLELAVATTDQAYLGRDSLASYRVGLAGAHAVSVPSVAGTSPKTGTVPVAAVVGIAVVGLLALLGWVFGALRRGTADHADAELGETSIAVDGMSKSFSTGVPVVNELTMRVERSQIVGLLGPNGAGKTTTLRMLLGLITPTSGQVRAFGHRVTPGAPVLSRVGALVEEPGFLPHLSGIDNLRYYWAATGRDSQDAHLEQVLEIAGLGEDANRPVRTYSQGMRQRLGIAQAMLGFPDLLVLDEPATGLDPPQIRRLRDILRRYADTGRAVLLSSHLLAEVEQICTHVVLMHGGSLVTAGTVQDVVGTEGETTFEVDDPDRAATTLRGMDGVTRVETEEDMVHVDLAGWAPATAIRTLVTAGLAVRRVGPRRRLEDAFVRLVGEER